MYQVKKEYIGIGTEVRIQNPELIRKGFNPIIPLDRANQKELKFLYEKGHPYVEKKEVKKEQAK